MLSSIEKNLFENGFENFILFTVVTLILSFILNKMISKLQKYIQEKNKGYRNATFRYLFKTLRVLLFTLSLFLILSEIKPLKVFGTTLLGATSILAVILGLAAQESFGNYISGFFMAIYEPFHIGDFIVLPEKNISGKVVEVNFRHIVIETINQSRIIIPNSTMNSTIIEDRTGINYKNKIYVCVTYDTDIEKARNIIVNVVNRKDDNLKIDGNSVFVENLNESSVDLCFFVEGKTVGESYKTACDVREQLLEEFPKYNIQFAYPTRTIYIEKGEK